MIPFPTPIAIKHLREHPSLAPLHGGRVSTELLGGGPSLRLILLPGGGVPDPAEWRAEFQVEAWAADELDAGRLATAVRDAWPGLRGPVTDGYVSRTWISVEPFSAGDRDSTLARYIVTAGMLLHPPKEV